MSSIMRLDEEARMSQAVIHGSHIYLAGQVGAPDQSVAEQTKAALTKIDTLLARAGSDRDHILSASIWLSDIADYNEMNGVWDEWIANGRSPARATCEAKLASPDYKVEITIFAVKRD